MITTTLAMPASAAWKKTSNGVQWTDSTGKAVKSKWLSTANGSKYYINSKGYRSTGLVTMKLSNGVKATYYFNKNGVMQTGWQYINKKYYYFQTNGQAIKNKKVKIGSYSFKFDANGRWNGIVYQGTKNVTSKVDIATITGIGAKNTASTTTNTTTASTSKMDLKTTTMTQAELIKSLGVIPKTVTICGIKVSTDVKKLPVEFRKKEVFANATDKDLENLKYLTKLEDLVIDNTFDTVLAEITEKYGAKSSEYQLRVSAAHGVQITNLDFCLYMPNLNYIEINNCPKLTDLSGLRKCKNLEHIVMYACDGLKDLRTLDSFASLGHKFRIELGFSRMLNNQHDYVFTDWEAYKRPAWAKNCAWFYVSRSVNYDNCPGAYVKTVPSNFKSVNKKTYKYINDVIKLGGVYGGTMYGRYSETLQAYYGESVYNENNKRKGKDNVYGNGVDWTSDFMRTDNTKGKTDTVAYVKIMKDCGVLDMVL